MASLDYVDIPTAATRLQPKSPSKSTFSIRPAPTTATKLPNPTTSNFRPPHTRVLSNSSLTSSTSGISSPTQTALNILPQILLAGSIPNTPPSENNARQGKLISVRDPLSLPIMTANFRRFVSKVGPVFWLQDRIEEIIMWRRGWRLTGTWMAAYTFICFFPRLVLVLPVVTLLSIMLATYPYPNTNTEPSAIPGPPPHSVSEGSGDWQANIQAIQNLMGIFSDAHELITPFLPLLSLSRKPASPYAYPLVTFLAVATIASLCLLPLLPLRQTFLTLGLSSFLILHPKIRPWIPMIFGHIYTSPQGKRFRTRLVRVIDNSRLSDDIWRSELREVELWENERWGVITTSSEGAEEKGKYKYSKLHLRPDERNAWTRGRDGWTGLGSDGKMDISSNLTFSLAPAWDFVGTEDWRPDLEATWIEADSDSDGWVYTNDAWIDPQPPPTELWEQESKSRSTRRRRWVRRIYFDPKRDKVY